MSDEPVEPQAKWKKWQHVSVIVWMSATLLLILQGSCFGLILVPVTVIFLIGLGVGLRHRGPLSWSAMYLSIWAMLYLLATALSNIWDCCGWKGWLNTTEVSILGCQMFLVMIGFAFAKSQVNPQSRWLNRFKWSRPIVGLALLLLTGVCIYEGWSGFRKWLPMPWTIHTSGPIDDSNSTLLQNGNATAFSPDGTKLAYVHCEKEHYFPLELGTHGLTMAASIEIRWFDISNPSVVRVIPLDSIDLRPGGKVYYDLQGKVRFSPDSRQLAAICARHILLIDLASGSLRKIEYPGEYFQDLNWRTDSELVFATIKDGKPSLYRLSTASDASREMINELDIKYASMHPELPPSLADLDWSPCRRFILWGDGIMDLESGRIHEGVGSNYMCWKSDDSAVVCVNSDDNTLHLIDTTTWESTDLTAALKADIGKDVRLTLVSGRWTPDNRYIILYNTIWETQKHTGCLIQPNPFKIILKRDQIIRWSPVRGWVFLQGGNDFEAVDYTGTRHKKVSGWPNAYLWSPDGQHAAEIKDGKVVVFKPNLPEQIDEILGKSAVTTKTAIPAKDR